MPDRLAFHVRPLSWGSRVRYRITEHLVLNKHIFFYFPITSNIKNIIIIEIQVLSSEIYQFFHYAAPSC